MMVVITYSAIDSSNIVVHTKFSFSENLYFSLIMIYFNVLVTYFTV